jgi:hypothetical protein
MGRQLFQDGPFIDPAVISPAAYSTLTINPLWPAAVWTPIFANDPKAGKTYVVKAKGIITMSVATCTLVLTPRLGAAALVLGASPAQLLPVMANIPWTLDAELTYRVIGAPGLNSSCVCIGKMCLQGTLATAGTGTNVVFGGTLVTTTDVTINQFLEICTTLGGTTGAPSIQTHDAYIFARN